MTLPQNPLQDALQDAFNRSLQDIHALNPLAVAAHSGTTFQEGHFLVPFFNQRLCVDYASGSVTEDGTGKNMSLLQQVILLHYLIGAHGVGVADRWMSYRYLPGGYFSEQKFLAAAIQPLLRAFGKNPEGLKRAGLRLGGIPIDRFGDVAFRFLALPRIPMACVLYLGDEDIPPSVNILFDEAACEYLPTEDLIQLAAHLGRSLRQP